MTKLNLWKTMFLVWVLCSLGMISSRAQTFTTLVSFDHANGGKPNAIVQGADGNFYGTTNGGGANDCFSGYGCGTVFKMAPAGTLTSLYSFCSQTNCSDGATPDAGLTQAPDGSFLGTNTFDGLFGGGTIFQITPTGAFSSLYSFCAFPGCLDGSAPVARLLPTSNGSVAGTTFYGMTSLDGPFGHGTIFNFLTAVAPTVVTVYSFCAQPGCTDGFDGSGPLIQATDGNFYGTTFFGGANNSASCDNLGCGTVFSMAPLGGSTFTTLYSFCSQPNCTDGFGPGGLIQAKDGNFYGATAGGGTNCFTRSGCGEIFKLTPAGVLTVLYRFCSLPNPETNCPDGAFPGGLIQATDGNLYGTTTEGGANGAGTIFKLSPAGTLTTLYSFCSQTGCADGATPTGVIQGTDGNFYGSTFSGASSNCFGGCGTVFKLSLFTTPQQATQQIIDSVNALFSQGVLNQGQDNSLVTQLQHAIDLINAGKNNGAIGNLDAFIGEVNDLLSSGLLSASQADSLVSAADTVIAHLS